MTIPVSSEQATTSLLAELVGNPTRSTESVKIEQAKAMIWSALAVIAIMAALLAILAVVPLAVLIYTAVF